MSQDNSQSTPKDAAQSFAGSVFKFSISTYVSFGITGLAIILGNILVPDTTVNGYLSYFITVTNLVMAVGVLGLDQSFMRFFYEPPKNMTPHGLLRVCFSLSSVVLVLGGIVALLFPTQLAGLLGFPEVFASYVAPLLFFNAFAAAVARYLNLLLRMEQRMALYTIQSVLTVFFTRLFPYFGSFFAQQQHALLLFAAGGMCLYALALMLWQRKLLRPRKADWQAATLRPAIKAILPYGLYTSPTQIILHLNNTAGNWLLLKLTDEKTLGYGGVYNFTITLAGIVTTVQAGFSTFWGAYMFANYKTQQERIKKVHDFLNFIILVFFCILVAAQDIIFVILYNRQEARFILPLMMLGAAFAMLCEGTTYGIAIARRPIFDTLGFVLALVLNVGLCLWLVPLWGLLGAAFASAAANLGMFLFRTVIAQKFYTTIRYPTKTALALLIACVVAAVGTLWTDVFWLRLAVCIVAIAVYCVLYTAELRRCIALAKTIFASLFNRQKV